MTPKQGDKISILVNDKMEFIYEKPSSWHKINLPKREILVNFLFPHAFNGAAIFSCSDIIENISTLGKITEYCRGRWLLSEDYIGHFIYEINARYCKFPTLVKFNCYSCGLEVVDYSSPFKNFCCYQCNSKNFK